MKDMRYSLLLDFYGEVLSQSQRDMMELYYNEDLSLSEIAEDVGITRQGVYDAIHRAEESLNGLESKLLLVARFETLRRQRDEALSSLDELYSLVKDDAPASAFVREIRTKLISFEI